MALRLKSISKINAKSAINENITIDAKHNDMVKHFKDLKKEALDAIKAPKYTTNDVLKFMKLPEVVKLYKENKAELKKDYQWWSFL